MIVEFDDDGDDDGKKRLVSFLGESWGKEKKTDHLVKK